MGSIVRLSGSLAAAALASAALAAAQPAALAQTTAGAQTVVLPCSTAALVTAINTANGSVIPTTLRLAPNCTYSIITPATVADGLPPISKNITLVGGPSTVISRSPFALTSFRILEVTAAGTLGVNGISLLNGSTAGLGGGILNAGTLTVTNAKFSGNAAGNGGGLANSAGATATVNKTLMSANTTTGVGGGAILNSGSLTLFQDILDSNSAPINGGGLNTQAAGISRVMQTTVTHNTSGSLGGGISNLGTTLLDGSQVRHNQGSAGGGIATANNNVILRTTIVRDNTPDNCSPLNTIPGCVN